MLNEFDVERFLPLKPNDFHIMFALLDGIRHGYRISRDIEETTGGTIRLEAGNLHRTIQKLMRLGLVEVTDRIPPDDPGDERRRYYALTPLGRRVVAADAARMRDVVRAAEEKNIIAESGASR